MSHVIYVICYAICASDNKNIRVLFSVRNPIERAVSHHRFIYSEFARFELGDINFMTAFALQHGMHYAALISYQHLLSHHGLCAYRFSASRAGGQCESSIGRAS